MALAQVAISLSAVGIAVTAVLAALFIRDPVSGMAHTTHRAEQLPQVMAGRYVALTFLALGATIYGDLKVIAWLFAAFAIMAFADTWIYARGGYPVAKHLGAGVLASVVVIVALVALCRG